MEGGEEEKEGARKGREEGESLTLESLRLEYDLKRMEIEAGRERERLRLEAESERERLRLLQRGGDSESAPGQDASLAGVSLLPEFSEEEAESFFLHFEKVAALREWKREDWALLVQSRLKGKAREAFLRLGPEESLDYGALKEAVLGSVRLDPEACRRAFRSLRKLEDQTYSELARRCTAKFDRWCRAEGVKGTEDLKQLILMEQFRGLVHPDFRVEVVRNRPRKVMEAALQVDEAVHRHKMANSQ